eukprot:scaffold3389_cov119-Cylindrotheca_fusiformis.AAC.5
MIRGSHGPFLAVICSLLLSLARAQFDIGTPVKEYQGLTVKLNYKVQSARKPDEVNIKYFKDEECEVPMTWTHSPNNKPFFNADVYNGASNPDGTKMMTVDISMEVTGISESEIVNELNGVSYIAYCVRFEFVDKTNEEILNKKDQEIIVGVDLKGSIGITGFLEDEEQNFRADSYFCDDSNKQFVPSGPLLQGTVLRICVSPDANTHNFGVVINRINNLFLLRDDIAVTRAIIRDRGVVEDPRVTDVDCRTASQVCSVATTPSNEFFVGEGEVVARGEVVLMYSYDTRRRRAVRIPLDVGHRRVGNLAGLDAGNSTIRIPFQIKPAQASHKARLYRCNELNEELTADEQSEPLYRGDAVRVCAIPDELAVQNSVTMHQIGTFTFTQPGEHSQVAVSDIGRSVGNTMVICQSGDPVCVFKTYLDDSFFDERKPIQGKGEVVLQYGDERIPVGDKGGGTNPAVAGISTLEFTFPITLSEPPAGRNSDFFEDAENWWDNTPIAMKVLYILAFIIIILLCLICFFILIFGVPDIFNKKGKAEEDEEFFKDAPFIPPNAVRSNVLDNPHFCNSLKNPEEYYADPDAEYMPNQSSRGMEDTGFEDEPEDPAPLLSLTYGDPTGDNQRGYAGSDESSEFQHREID